MTQTVNQSRAAKDKPSELKTSPASIVDKAAAVDADINARMNAHVNDTAASQADRADQTPQTIDDEGPCGR